MARRFTLDTGIHQEGDDARVVTVTVGGVRQARRFPRETPLAELQAFRKAWIAEAGPITLTFTRAQLAALWHMVENTWDGGDWHDDFLDGSPEEQRAAREAYDLVTAAQQAVR